jgi:hypothetical protein
MELTMLNRKRIAGSTLALSVGPALLFALGCSDSGIGKTYSVSGTVKYKGAPVDKARINFVPKSTGGSTHGAFGQVTNGTFSSLTTLTDGDGALPGDYIVTVDTREIDADKVKSQSSDLASKHKMEKVSQIPPELQAKALKEAKATIPGKYQLPETTDLNAKVEPKSNRFEFELKD